jgi:hypothetical protein
MKRPQSALQRTIPAPSRCTARQRRRLPPPLLFDVRPSRRVLAVWWAWCLGLVAALLLAGGLPWWGRLLASAAVMWLSRAGHCQLWSDPAAIRQLGWDAAGEWMLCDASGALAGVTLEPPLWPFGPLLWVGFRVAGQKRWVLLDRAVTEPAALCALKARVQLLRG